MEQRIGPHTVRINGNLAELTLVGMIGAEHMPPVLALLDGANGGAGRCYVLADLRSVAGVSPDARRIASQWSGVRRIHGIAVIGASLIIRTLVLLVARANTLLSGTTKSTKIAFFQEADEALAWLQQSRAEASE